MLRRQLKVDGLSVGRSIGWLVLIAYGARIAVELHIVAATLTLTLTLSLWFCSFDARRSTSVDILFIRVM